MKSEDYYPTWKGYLYRLQQESPKPRPVLCQTNNLQSRPHFYGPECHGLVSRIEGGALCREDGDYLIRESQNDRGRFTLVMRVLGVVKNFKLYYEDGKHFVGEKRFDSVYDLVEDGLITMFVESKAQDYIERMVHEPVYNSLSRYSAAGSRAGTLNGRNHTTPQVYSVDGMETERAAVPLYIEQAGYAPGVRYPANPAHEPAVEYGVGYVPRNALEQLDFVASEADNYQRYHNNAPDDLLLRRNDSGGMKKNLTPTSSDERKRTKKRFATENDMLRYPEEHRMQQQHDVLHHQFTSIVPEVSRFEPKPRRISHGVTSHPNIVAKETVPRRMSSGTVIHPAYHRPTLPQHQPTTVAHVKQLNGGLDARLSPIQQTSPRRENESVTRSTRFGALHSSFEEQSNPYNASRVKESLPAVREGNSLEQIMAVHRHLEGESVQHKDNIHVRQSSEPTELLYHHQQKETLFDTRIHESAIYQETMHNKDALLRHKLRQRQHGSNDRAGSVGSCESGISNSSSNSSVPIHTDRCDTSSSHYTDSGSRMSSEDDRNTPSPRHTTGIQRRASESPKLGYGQTKVARQRQLTRQQATTQVESPWQPRDDLEQKSAVRSRSSSSGRKRPPLTLHNPNYNDVIEADVTSHQKDRDRKNEKSSDRVRNDANVNKEDLNPAYRNLRKKCEPEPSPDSQGATSGDDPRKLERVQSAPLKDKRRPKNSIPPDSINEKRPMVRRATTNDLISKAKNANPTGPSKDKMTSHAVEKTPSPVKSKKSVTSPVMSPSPRHRNVTSPSKKSPSKLPTRPKCLLAQQYEKEHHYKSHTYRGLQWCEYCGNFMWGIIQQGVQCIDCGLNVHKQCSKLVPNDCQPALKHVQHVFGVDLTTLVKLHGTQRPIVVDMCISEIEKRGMDSEGIYRVSGSHDEIIELKAAFDQLGSEVNLTAYEDVNTIAGALKLYLRELPVPILPYRLYSRFINAAKISHEDGKLDAVRMALSATPGAHFETIKYLIQHLGRVSDISGENQMTSHNLGIVFGPTLLRTPEKDANQRYNYNDTQFQQGVIESMIEYRHHLFGPD